MVASVFERIKSSEVVKNMKELLFTLILAALIFRLDENAGNSTCVCIISV